MFHQGHLSVAGCSCSSSFLPSRPISTAPFQTLWKEFFFIFANFFSPPAKPKGMKRLNFSLPETQSRQWDIFQREHKFGEPFKWELSYSLLRGPAGVKVFSPKHLNLKKAKESNVMFGWLYLEANSILCNWPLLFSKKRKCKASEVLKSLSLFKVHFCSKIGVQSLLHANQS